ncbi:MAG: hypothetical protein RL154_251 [Pseudomonadota bacterium]|jgi:radical SAM protein with 4Fe4S-binding SPASM domain
MSLTLFDKIANQLSSITKRVALHLRGDPLAVENLDEYLAIAKLYNLQIELTTNSYYLKQNLFDMLLSQPVVQINFSIQSILANQKLRNIQNDLDTVFKFCDYALKFNNRPFINLRLWAMQDSEIVQNIKAHFNTNSDRLAAKIRLNYAPLFEWASLNNQVYNDSYCHAPFDQFGILSNGKVVPCCLDKDGIIELGNIKTESLKDILSSQRVQIMKSNFKNNIVVEELCKHCSYRLKFDQ